MFAGQRGIFDENKKNQTCKKEERKQFQTKNQC